MNTLTLLLHRVTHAAHINAFLRRFVQLPENASAARIEDVSAQVSGAWAEVIVNLSRPEVDVLRDRGAPASELLAELIAPSFNDAVNVLFRDRRNNWSQPPWKDEAVRVAARAAVRDGVVTFVPYSPDLVGR